MDNSPELLALVKDAFCIITFLNGIHFNTSSFISSSCFALQPIWPIIITSGLIFLFLFKWDRMNFFHAFSKLPPRTPEIEDLLRFMEMTGCNCSKPNMAAIPLVILS